jgi:ribosomal protein L20A (L18A)
MKASEYQVTVPSHLKDFKWDGRGQTSLNWQKFKNKFEDVAKITRVEKVFEKNSSLYQWRRTSYDAIRSVRDVSASTEIRCKAATTCQKISGV